MPANVESMFYVKSEGVPWHGLGTPVAGVLTAEEAIVAAGMDWSVTKKPLLTKDGEWTRDYYGVVRQDTGDVLGVVTGRYRVYQNSEAFKFFDEVVGEKMAIYHTAGSLDGGRKIWILAKLPGELYITRSTDVTEKYILLATSHDGSMPVMYIPTDVRVVCQNTFQAALNKRGSEGISIRHTLRLTDRVQEARVALGLINQYYDKMQVIINQLADTPITQAEIDVVVAKLIPSVAEEQEEKVRVARQREAVKELFETSPGNDSPRIRGTAYALFEAATDFADHYKPIRASKYRSREDARLHSAWFGNGFDFKRAALVESAKLAGMDVSAII